MASVITFSRKNRSRGAAGDSSEVSSAASTYVTAPSVLTPVPESPGVEQDENASVGTASTGKAGERGSRNGDGGSQPAVRWRRKNAAERQEAERRQHLAEMRAYFEEVDAYELAVETPPAAKRSDARHTPVQAERQGGGVARALAAAAPTPGTALRQRAMSLGLSRRRSSMAAWPAHTVLASTTKASQHASPLKLSLPPEAAQEQRQGVQLVPGRRTTLLQLAPSRLSVAADNSSMVGGSPGGGRAWAVSRHSLAMRGRRSSVAPSRLSGTGRVLSRLSLGLTDALQWLGIKGKIPTAAEADAGAGAEGAAMAAAAAAPGAVPGDRPALSPIASPGLDEEEGSPAADDSPLPASMAVTALEQQQESGLVASSPAAELAADGVGPAVQPLPTPVAEDTAAEQEAFECQEQEAQGELPAAEQDQSAAPAAPAESAAAAGLDEQLAAKLQLWDEAAEEAAEEAAALPAAVGAAVEEQWQLETANEADAALEEAEEAFTPLQQLLLLCGQETDPELLPSMDELLGRHVDLKKVRKIGEGTFGEAFKAGGVVLKIVPMEGSILVNGEPQKRADEILAEVSVTLTLSRLNGAAAAPGAAPDNVTSGFVETFGVGICRGAYSEALRKEWHRWDEENESENEPVDCFAGRADQLFVVFVVADGGVDLEHFELRSFQEVRSILLQTALTVAVAEEACEFEHRDLHWGNLLIRRGEAPAATSAMRARLRGVDLEAATEGVTVTLIDFTLSRLVTVTGEVAFCDLAADPELFKGPKNSVQAETYRRMKKATKNSWQAHVPATNVFWMQYLVDTCITEKKGWGCRREELAELRAFKRRASACASCAELLFDDFLRPGLLIKD